MPFPSEAGTPVERAALSVVDRLRTAGRVAYLAGGCVRDMLLGRPPKDYDVVTDATPDEIVGLFRRTRKVGMQFGVVLVGVQRHWVEVATFRSDGDYLDGRRPESVRFTDAREDALRRDFTINGMFYDPESRTVIDHVGGQADIRARLIRAIGDPHLRFQEDYLRMLRAVRFAARFGFEIEPKTSAAIVERAPSIREISTERVRMELEMMLSDAGRAMAFRLLLSTGLFGHLWPGAESLVSVEAAIDRWLAALPRDAGFDVALAVVLHPLTPADAEQVCRRLTCSNRTVETMGWLVENQATLVHPNRLALADLKLLMAHGAFQDLLLVHTARHRAFTPTSRDLDVLMQRIGQIPADQISPAPFATGHDLAGCGLPPGPIYKQLLDRVYYAQLNGELTDRPAALVLLDRLIAEARREGGLNP